MPADDDIIVTPADATGLPAPKPEKNPVQSSTDQKKYSADSLDSAASQMMANAKEFYRGFEQQRLPKDFDEKGRPLRELYAHKTYEQKPDGTVEAKERAALDPRAQAIRENIFQVDQDGNQSGDLVNDLGQLNYFFQHAKAEQAHLEHSQDYDLALRGFSQDPRSGEPAGVPVVAESLKENFEAQIDRLKGLHDSQLNNLINYLGDPDNGIDIAAANIIVDFANDNNGIPGGKAQELLDKLQEAGVSQFAIDQTESLLIQQNDARQLLLTSYNAQIDRTNQAIAERIAIEQGRTSRNYERKLSARHTNMLGGYEDYQFRGDLENVDQDTLREGKAPEWYQAYNDMRNNAFKEGGEGRLISADVVTEPTMTKKGLYGQFVVSSSDNGQSLSYSLQINPGTPKKIQIEMWGRKLAKEAPYLKTLNLQKLKARFGPEGIEAIAKQILAVNPGIKLTGVTLSPALTSPEGRGQLHAKWCAEHNISPNNPAPIAQLALDPADIFTPRKKTAPDQEVVVEPPQAGDDIHVTPPDGKDDIIVELPDPDEVMVELPPFDPDEPAIPAAAAAAVSVPPPGPPGLAAIAAKAIPAADPAVIPGLGGDPDEVLDGGKKDPDIVIGSRPRTP